MQSHRAMNSVSVVACDDYAIDHVTDALNAALTPLGGMAAFVAPGQRVLLKVNLLSRALPERAVTTHPEVVRALIRSVRDAGGIPVVGDSPGGPNTLAQVRRVWNETGIAAVCEEESAELVLFDDRCTRVAAPGGLLYSSFTVGAEVVEADVLITVPKFKTHGLMMFTGAVKNLFGCIPGLQKAQYHLTVPDRHDFGEMLVDLALACRPALSVMDAVVGMEGEGPAGGDPRHIGALLASADPFALDVVASAMAGLDPLEVYTVRAAAGRGLGPSAVGEIDVSGDWRSFAPSSFALPTRDLAARLPVWLGRRLRTLTTSRPRLDRQGDCTRCRVCAMSCPVDAITVGVDGPVFDHAKCIRCYCCQELCPPQAIGLDTPVLARLVSRERRSDSART